MLAKEDIQIIAELIHNEVAPLDQRMGNIENRMDSLDQRMGNMENRMDSQDQRMGTLETEMRELNQRQAALEDKTDRVLKVVMDLSEASVETLSRAEKLLEKMDHKLDLMVGIAAAQDAKLLDHENRITVLEEKVS